MPTLRELRDAYHADLIRRLWGVRVSDGEVRHTEVEGHSFPVFNNADGDNDTSVVLCAGVASRVNVPEVPRTARGSTSGSMFEKCTSVFVSGALELFAHTQHRRLITSPPATHFAPRRRLPGRAIWSYAQFQHLFAIQQAVEGNTELQAALGGDYLVKPDILVLYEPFSDDDLNAGGAGLDADIGSLSPIRASVGTTPHLHASISCKWTMRRDRAQNTRLEALNLVRNRKGRLPHVAAVTMECDPEILGSLSLGTGDIDCVYHGALTELIDAAEVAATTFGGGWTATLDTLDRMIVGSRLRDIADLPLDLLS